MKSFPLLAATLLSFAVAQTSALRACDCGKSSPTKSASTSAGTADSEKSAPRKFPLKGVITDVMPDQSALMVKHEAIPGVMKAMTMMFTVEPAALASVKKGDAITAVMYRDGDTWRLEDVKVIPPAN
ncbi:MAG: copper-binding protein [Nibricoccus sp.]